MEAFLDLNKAQVDSTWQMGVIADRRNKWPPVKVMLAGPLRELGARPKTLAAEDFVRAVLVRKMEGDITKLEGLNKPQPAPAAKGWRHRRKMPRRNPSPASPSPPPQPRSLRRPLRTLPKPCPRALTSSACATRSTMLRGPSPSAECRFILRATERDSASPSRTREQIFVPCQPMGAVRNNGSCISVG